MLPKFFGLVHLNTDEEINHHRERTHITLSIPDALKAVICDGVPAYVEKSIDLKEQKNTWNEEKKRNCYRFMMMTYTSGYIVDAIGTFPGKYNYPKIIPAILNDPNESVKNFLIPNPHLLLDRGFIIGKSSLRGLGCEVHYPLRPD